MNGELQQKKTRKTLEQRLWTNALRRKISSGERETANEVNPEAKTESEAQLIELEGCVTWKEEEDLNSDTGRNSKRKQHEKKIEANPIYHDNDLSSRSGCVWGFIGDAEQEGQKGRVGGVAVREKKVKKAY